MSFAKQKTGRKTDSLIVLDVDKGVVLGLLVRAGDME